MLPTLMLPPPACPNFENAVAPYARTSFVDDPLILWFTAAKTLSKKMMILWTLSKKVKNKIDISL